MHDWCTHDVLGSRMYTSCHWSNQVDSALYNITTAELWHQEDI